jgi:KaiC/GvpD/RAD55 family RecA-like ATPase
MRPRLSKEELARLAARSGADIASLVEDAKDFVADARNGEWSTESRKCAIAAIDAAITEAVARATPKDPAKADDGLGNMI